jgi:hypothetical protein
MTVTQAQSMRFKKGVENKRRELVSEIHAQTNQIAIDESHPIRSMTSGA